jgi:hypothetical protein
MVRAVGLEPTLGEPTRLQGGSAKPPLASGGGRIDPDRHRGWVRAKSPSTAAARSRALPSSARPQINPHGSSEGAEKYLGEFVGKTEVRRWRSACTDFEFLVPSLVS